MLLLCTVLYLISTVVAYLADYSGGREQPTNTMH